MIDPGNWSAVALVGTYLGCLALAARYLARPNASHVLLLAGDQPLGYATRSTSLSSCLIAVMAALAWSAGLAVIETWAIGRLAPHYVDGFSCEPRWLPPLSCELPDDLPRIAGRRLGFAALAAYGTVALAVWLTARDRSLLPLAMLALALLGLGALADVVADASSPARPDILFGAVAAVQLTAAAGLAFSLATVLPRPAAILRVHAVYLAVLALRLLALLSWALLWPLLPSATAVSTLVALVLVPGVAGGAAIAAAAQTATGRRVQP